MVKVMCLCMCVFVYVCMRRNVCVLTVVWGLGMVGWSVWGEEGCMCKCICMYV